MKKILQSINKKSALIFTALLLVGSLAASAQIGLPGDDDGNVIDVPPPDRPIDGFIITGLIAGAAIGFRKHIKGLKK